MACRITDRDIEVLRAIWLLQKRWGGHQPTVREIGDELGISSPGTVQKHLDKLAAFHLIDKRRGSRVITTEGWSTLNRTRLAEEAA